MVVMSHKGHLLVVTVFALAVLASGQAQKKRKTTHTTTVCHDLMVRVSETRFDKPNTSTTEEMEQALSRENEAHGLKHQIDRCVMETPARLSVKDWQLAVLAEASLQQEFDQVTAAFEVQQERDAAQVNSEMLHERDQQLQKTVGEDYSFIYTQVFGLVLEFCGAGGQVTNRQWVPLGTKDFSSIIAALPDDVDAIYLGLGGADAVNFLNQYQQAGGKAHLMGGSIMIDQTILSSKGSAKNALIGTIAASGQADTWEDPRWQKFVKAYQDSFPENKRFPSPSLLATNYYGSTMALILGLRQVNGDLSNNQAKLKEALAKIELDAPNGKIKLDSNRQAIGTNFVTEVVDDGKGALFSKVVKVIPDVNQTLGYDPAVFAKIGLPGRTVPECKKY